VALLNAQSPTGDTGSGNTAGSGNVSVLNLGSPTGDKSTGNQASSDHVALLNRDSPTGDTGIAPTTSGNVTVSEQGNSSGPVMTSLASPGGDAVTAADNIPHLGDNIARILASSGNFGGGGAIVVGRFKSGVDSERLASLSAAERTRLANRCLWILKHPRLYAKRVMQTCLYVARRIPQLAQAVSTGQRQ
jgi:hypothetical protein